MTSEETALDLDGSRSSDVIKSVGPGTEHIAIVGHTIQSSNVRTGVEATSRSTSISNSSSGSPARLQYSRFSDFTDPTSNVAREERMLSPPRAMHPPEMSSANQDEELSRNIKSNFPYGNNYDLLAEHDADERHLTPPRRNIFGVAVEEKYQTSVDFSHCHTIAEPTKDKSQDVTVQHQPSPNQPLVQGSSVLSMQVTEQQQNGGPAYGELLSSKMLQSDPEREGVLRTNVPVDEGLEHGILVIEAPAMRPVIDQEVSEFSVSEVTLPGDWQSTLSNRALYGVNALLGTSNGKKLSYGSNKDSSNKNILEGGGRIGKGRSKNSSNDNRKNTWTSAPPPPHETIHAQSLLLGLAFCTIWSPSNLMAPNLTEMADFFQFDKYQRDMYLGSYCALATGVFSFPIGAGIGILADLVNRKYLFCLTLVGGAISSWATGQATNFFQLFLARLLNGGFMSGSVPVAFSLLGDLFVVEERNAASSGLTAMMGLGIILGQVYSGMVGPTLGWQHAFGVSAIVTLILATFCLAIVKEPVRGGKEKVLQDMIRSGTRYERKLSWQGFWHACLQNQSNSILLWQGFFSSLPWGIVFVFLNDYLSQERGFSVPAATYLVFLFGLGCAVGGVLGGYWGQLVQRKDRRLLPLFMAFTTEFGILPFLGMLNVKIPRAHGTLGVVFAFGSGLVASLPSVNVRPCLINVNPPETRGAALTAANLLINLGRGVGPSCVTLLGLYNVTRQNALNLTLTTFWTISAVQLIMLAKTLPRDQDAMEAELAQYAASAIKERQGNGLHQLSLQALSEESALTNSVVVLDASEERAEPILLNEQPDQEDYTISCNESIELSIEDRMTYFDGVAVNETLVYMREGFREFKDELIGAMPHCGCAETTGELSSEEDCESGRNSEVDYGLATDENSKYRHDADNHGPESALHCTSAPDAHPNEKTPLMC